MKLDQYIMVNSFDIYAKRHDIKDLDKAAQDLNIVYEFSNALNHRVPNLKLYHLSTPVQLRKYLINALETQKRDKAKHEAYVKRLEAQHIAKEDTNSNKQVLNDKLDKLKNLDLSDEDMDKMLQLINTLFN